ncbi:MAG TPA: acyltransferase [Candidatus Obscuribacterales bacterium]
MQKALKARYFHNLDSLRFIAASLVIIHHAEQFKQLAGLPNCWGSPIVFDIGVQAVQFFFVLSGFLITYLLLQERQSQDAVNIPNFYRRRIVRIWPLYYVTTLLAFVLIPMLHFGPGGIQYYQQQLHINFWPDLFCFLVFLPNLQLSLFTPVLAGAQCWSLGVEEQFYLIWPALIKFFGRFPLRVLFAVFFAKTLILRMCVKLHAPHPVSHYFQTLSIEAMALGGIAAYLMLNGATARRAKLHTALCTLACIIAAVILKYDRAQLVSLLAYAVIVFVAASLPRIGGKLQAPFEYLGRISYGVYMLHPIVLVVCLWYLQLVPLGGNDKSTLLYLLAFPLTILTAACSYKFFERPLMKTKAVVAPVDAVAVLKSGEHVVMEPELVLHK